MGYLMANQKAGEKAYLTWHNGSSHLLTAPGQGERDQSAVEQRFGQV